MSVSSNDDHCKPLHFSRRRDRRVEDDELCVECGYNLRALELMGQCPECSADVLDSVFGAESRPRRLGTLLLVVVINMCALRVPAVLLFKSVDPSISARDMIVLPVLAVLGLLGFNLNVSPFGVELIFVGVCVLVTVLAAASYTSMRCNWRWRLGIVLALTLWSMAQEFALLALPYGW